MHYRLGIENNVAITSFSAKKRKEVQQTFMVTNGMDIVTLIVCPSSFLTR